VIFDDFDMLTNRAIPDWKVEVDQHLWHYGIQDLIWLFLDECSTVLQRLQEDFCVTFDAHSNEPDRWNSVNSVAVRRELSLQWLAFLQRFIVLVRGINLW